MAEGGFTGLLKTATGAGGGGKALTVFIGFGGALIPGGKPTPGGGGAPTPGGSGAEKLLVPRRGAGGGGGGGGPSMLRGTTMGPVPFRSVVNKFKFRCCWARDVTVD